MPQNNEATLPWRVLAKQSQVSNDRTTGNSSAVKVQECGKTFGSTSCRKQWQNGASCPGCCKQK